MLKIKNKKFDNFNTLFCIPITAQNENELILQLNYIEKVNPDVVEWRADYFKNISCNEVIQKCINLINFKIKSLPLILTMRRYNEGGKNIFDDSQRWEILKKILKTHLFDILDIEMSTEPNILTKAYKFCKNNNINIILSKHNFSKTPSQICILKNLLNMAQTGCDIVKIAYFSNSSRDTLNQLCAIEQFLKICPHILVISICMGNAGKISRVSTNIFGSCITFSSNNMNKSASGQINYSRLRFIVRSLST